MRSDNRVVLAMLASLMSALLAGCGMVGESASSSVMDPGRYEFHNCDQLELAARSLGIREQELVELTQRAAQSPGGQVIGAVSYRTELVQNRGYQKQITMYAQQKNCSFQSKRPSERAVW